MGAENQERIEACFGNRSVSAPLRWIFLHVPGIAPPPASRNGFRAFLAAYLSLVFSNESKKLLLIGFCSTPVSPRALVSVARFRLSPTELRT